jgi:hypothetical protein
MKLGLSSLFGAALLSVLTLSSASAQAQSLELGYPSYGGTGCPAGSASAVLSPDNSTLSILFDQYTVEAGGVTGRSIDRKSCNLAIPVRVPSGYSISLVAVDYRGYAAIPHGGRGNMQAEYFFAGVRGPRSVKNFNGGYNNVYTLTDNLVASAMVWSPCGADTTLRVNTSLMAQTNSSFQQALATVDSVDVSSGIVYHVQWRQCF